MFLARHAAILICAAAPLLAAPKLTTIQDTIYKADGSMFNGTAVISWVPFDAGDNSKIGLQSLTVQIVNGAIRVQLVPNSDATPVNNYTVHYSSDGKQQFSELWSVPPSTTPLRIKDVRVVIASGSSTTSGGGVVQPPSQTPISESSVTGLLTDLSLRPIRGSAYTTGRAAMVNDSGAIDSVEGNLSDCVRVDGSAGPCFDPTAVPSFVDGETPGGVVDGSNAAFTLAGTPDPASSLLLYRNGLVQHAGSDYDLQPDGSVLFVSAAVPQPGDILLASYRTGGLVSQPLTGVIAPQPVTALNVQVLCSGSGAGTTQPVSMLLGSCTIPARTLAIGDRVEIRFNLSHQGAANGFTFQVRWGQATIVQRTASSLDSMVTGHGDASFGPAGTALDMQSWGTSLALDSRVAAASDPLNADIAVDFLAGMTAAGTDTVALQNYTVLRYPAQ
jgi:hypothetical protein